MRICFFSSLDTNIGDDFIREGLVNLLNKAGIEFDASIINKHSRSSLIDQHGRNKILTSDYIVICGTPVFWSIDGSTSYNCDWYDWFYQDYIFKGKKNVFVLAAGSCNRLNEDVTYLCQNDNNFEKFVKTLCKKSLLVTTRDYICSNMLNNFEIAHDNLFCTAFHAMDILKNSDNSIFIGFNLMENFGHFNNFPMFLSKAKEMIKVIRKFGPIKFICHSSSEVEIANKFHEGDDFIFYEDNYKSYYSAFDDVRFHVSCRVHGSILSSSAGVPNVNIITDTRGLSCDRISSFLFNPFHESHEDLNSMLSYISDNLNSIKSDLRFLKKYNEQEYVKALKRFFCN